MSYSPLQKNSSSFLSPENLNRFLETLRQPTSIALIASAGIHGILWFTLPLMPSNSADEIDTQRQVKVVELSPAEQLRLPDFAASRLVVPPPASTTRRPLPQKTPKPAPDPLFQQDSPFYTLPLIPPPPVTLVPPLFDPPVPLSQTRVRVRQSPPATPRPAPKVETPPKAETETQQSAETPVPAETPAPEPTRPEKIPQAAIDELRDLQARGIDVYDGTGTKEVDGQNRYAEWLGKLKETGNLSEKVMEAQKIVNVPVAYPTEACPGKLSGDAAVGLFVDPEGKLVGEPELLQSSGYKRLNQTALEAAKNYLSEVKPGKDYQILLLRMPFEYSAEACSANGAEPTPAS